jgi:ABC-type sugar transport system permease subunit
LTGGGVSVGQTREEPVQPAVTRHTQLRNLLARFSLAGLSYTTQKRIVIATFSIVPLLLLITFTYVPVINLFRFSLIKWNGYSRNKEWVGLANYIRVFADAEYFSVFKVSLYYFFATFIQIGLALYFSTVLSFKVKGKSFFKGVIFFPFLMNGVAIGFIFLYFYRPYGALDSLLAALGFEQWQQFWLRDPRLVNVSVAGTSIWRYIGFNFVVFLGAIQSISGEIYDAAAIDGANRWQVFRFIIFPSILRIIQLNLILSIRGAISVFEIPYIMLFGANGSETFVIQTVDTAFKFSKVGLASSMAVILLVIVVLVTFVQQRLSGSGGEAFK